MARQPQGNHSNANHKYFKPQYQGPYSSHSSPYIPYGTSWENLSEHQSIVTHMFDHTGHTDHTTQKLIINTKSSCTFCI